MKVKRFLSLLLCLCMIFTLLPMMSIPASAKGSSGIRLGTGGITGYSSTSGYNYIYFGKYDTTDDSTNNPTPIKWRVLADTNGNGGTYKDGSNANVDGTNAMFLMSEFLLKNKIAFGNDNTWSSSDLRQWMQGDVYNSLTSFEKSQVLKTTTTGDIDVLGSAPKPLYDACQLSEDTLFAPSAYELTREAYGFSSWDIKDSKREALYNGKAAYWWLRSTYQGNDKDTGVIDTGGSLNYDPSSDTNFGAARPAFNLNKNSVLFASAATETAPGGKASGSEGADALAKVSTTKPTEWKLTLLDSTRNFGAEIIGASSDGILFAYSGAKMGANEYISAVIVDDLGYILYYGRIKNVTKDNSIFTIAIPSGVTLGSNATLKVFNEQYNGDYKTDYASEMQTVHNVSFSLMNLTNSGVFYVVNGSDFTDTLVADAGYILPKSISVTVGDAFATLVKTSDEADTTGEYYYNPSNGIFTVAKVNGPVVITAEGISAIITSPASLDFGSLTEGYTTAPNAQTVTIKNNGISAITGYTVTGGGTDFDVTYTSASIVAGGISTFTVKPAAGLAVGGHAKTLTIQTTEGSTATVNLNLTVQAKSSSGGGYSPTYYTISASDGKGGSISPSGSSSVENGNDMIYTITADKGYKIQDVLVDGVSVGAVSSYTFENVKKAHSITVSFKEKTVNPFGDVSKNDWFYENVMYVYENGLMTGSGSDGFSPNGTMTRGMIVTVLHRLSGDKGGKTNSFSDVPSGAWYETAAAWAAKNGIASGVGGNQFSPESSLTREQLAVMLYNYAKYKGLNVSIGENTNILSYHDAAYISDYARSALQWACGAGISKGDSSGNLNFQSSATRAEVAAMLQRFIESTTSD